MRYKPMGAMTMEELDARINSVVEKKMATEKEAIIAEMKAAGYDDVKIKDAVEARMKELKSDAERRKADREDMMAVFEAANAANATKGIAEVKGRDLFGKMLAAGLKTVEDSNVMNVKACDRERIADTYKKMYGSDVGYDIMKKELNAGTPTAGGFTIPQIMLPDVVDYLYAAAILSRLGVQKVPMPNGNFSLPRIDSTSAVSWVGETGTQTTATDIGIGDINLRSKKMMAKALISNSLLRYNTVGLDRIVSQDLQRVATIELDRVLLYGEGTEYTPRGLSKITGIQTPGSTSTAFGLTTPIDMVALLEQANVPMNDVRWILSPVGKSWIQSKAFSTGPFAWADEMSRAKTINGYEFISSATVAKASDSSYSDFWLMDVSMILWGVAYDLSIEMSRDGTFTSGGTTYSAFDKDLTLIRLIGEHDFGVRQPKAIVQGTYSKT
jgi:HK97 family phage major capsid protein